MTCYSVKRVYGYSDLMKVPVCHLLDKHWFAYLEILHAITEMGQVVPRDPFGFHLHLMGTELPPFILP